jgi:RimJ/RimL family protein N-acetyltransferase
MMERMHVLRTARLDLRQLALGDAPFLRELMNEPAWLRYIGDRGIRSVADAERYIEEGPARMYARFGFGLYLVETRVGGEPLGLCGLVKRDGLDDVDLGFAFLARFRGCGYAHESAAAILADARARLGLGRIVAITLPENHASRRLLVKLGFALERTDLRMGGDAALLLYAHAGPPPALEPPPCDPTDPPVYSDAG